MHDLPPIYDYVSKKYTADRSAEVTQCQGLVEFYGNYFIKSLHESDSNFLISVGSGDCWLEIEIVKYLLSKNETGFFFVCLELSPILIDKARKKFDAEGLGDVITVVQTDINKWKPRYTFAGVMAHHALHHFLSLETLFELIKTNLARHGRFVTCDMIGRNGHMRWPEALILTREIWAKLPRRYKFHHLFKKYDDYFDNWDCAVEGFEGIRAQDILPLLVKMFSFEVFFSHGNLIDPFLDRNFGPNYDPGNSMDTSIIDFIEELNERLITDGILKPTSMVAVMVNEEVTIPRIYKNWSPQFMIREPSGQPPKYEIDQLLQNFPEANKKDELTNIPQDNYSLNTKLQFGSNTKEKYSGLKFLTYGWSDPDPSFIWSNCEDAGVNLPIGKTVNNDLILSIEFIPYFAQSANKSLIEIYVNDILFHSLICHNNPQDLVVKIELPVSQSLIGTKQIISLRFMFPDRRQPQFESGDDLRALGIALISLKLSH